MRIENPPTHRPTQPAKTTAPDPIDFDRLGDKSLRIIGRIQHAIRNNTPEEQRLIMEAIRRSEYLP